MDMDILAMQALKEAISITGKPANNEETQKVAFQLACAAMAIEHKGRELENIKAGV